MSRARTAETSDLPPGIIVRKRPSGNYYYYQTSSVGAKRREYPLGKVRVQAIAKWREIASETPPAKQRVGLQPWVSRKLRNAVMANAKKRKIEFSLTLEDVTQLIEDSGGKCSLTGIEFDLFKDHGARARPWAPSIDRIDCALGYVVGNVRLVACAVNLALSDFGEATLLRIAKGLIKTKYGKVI